MSFWLYLDQHPPSELVGRVLPSAYGRFREARFFAERLRDLPLEQSHHEEADWYLSAHISAFIAIGDAAQVDFNRLGRPRADYGSSPLGKEDRLTSGGSNPQSRDPINANRAYRDLRNLRVHFAKPLLQLEKCSLCAATAWCLCPIVETELKQLKSPGLHEVDLTAVNAYLTRGSDHVTSQYLAVRLRVLEQTATELARHF